MQLLSGNALAACLTASTFLFGQAAAAPVLPSHVQVLNNLHARNNTGAGKRQVNWDYSLTGALLNLPGIQASADALSGSAEVKAVFNWESWRPTEIPSEIPHYPMVRTPDYIVSGSDQMNQIISSIEGNPDTGSPTIVHFYNEPERQSLSASTSADEWRSAMLPLRDTYGVQLVGPACASDDAGNAWCDEFMGYLGDTEKPDFFGVHWYSDETSTYDINLTSAQDFINGKHDTYGLDVIISEIASTNRDQAQVDSFTRDMTSWLDEQSFVRMYGFFGVSLTVVDDFVSPAAQQMDDQGNWNELGNYLIGLGA